ncbi:unnamed protein product [Chrysodeixis includens]|uniref:U6 snRNA phosphodiesterase n=1 Tax=Chrysodeixis includens TaxID=689277 RepID=A0A9N8KXD0_CHRIL|nr:unnamed protein product [Chrysodeixis includens]
MSALSSLCEYESNSDDSDSDLSSPKRLKRSKLPVPNLSKVAVVPLDSHKDDAVLHEGRKRSFPHVRGNWATFVYVNYHVDTLFELIEKLQEVVTARIGLCHHCENFHISLSRTFVLKYHLISPLSTSLQKALSGIDSFHLGFAAVKIYSNDENSRTFISLDVDPFAQKHLLNLTKKVDVVLNEFQLPTFYEKPSFHMSVLWVNGNKKSELESILEELNELFYENIEKSPASFLVDTVNSKSGNNNKVYINRNFSKGQKNNTSVNPIMHVNPKFSYLISNVQGNIQSKNKIYVNPNFIKPNSTSEPNPSATTTNQAVAATYQLQQKALEHNKNTIVQVPVSQSRYCFVRQTTTNTVVERPVHDKIKSTFKVNKYKSVPWNDIKKSLEDVKSVSTNHMNFSSHVDKTVNKSAVQKYTCFLAPPKNKELRTETAIYKYTNKKNNKTILISQARVKKVKGNLKKNNLPCPLFRKFGICLRSLRDKCEFLHDKKHVSICRKFVKGLCHDKNCLLSHDLTTKKMPTCYFYLQGNCTKTECPYLHVKLNDNTKICPDFIKGYCEKGSKCLMRHINIQTEKVNKSTTSLIRKSSSTNKGSKATKNDINMHECDDRGGNNNSRTKTNDTSVVCGEGASEYRYYQEHKVDESAKEYEVIKPMRCKLGDLPSFIEL